MSNEVEEGVTSMIQCKPSFAVSELTMNSAVSSASIACPGHSNPGLPGEARPSWSTINIDGYESKYTRNNSPVSNTQVVDENVCIPNFIKLSRYESKRKIVIPLDPNIHEHREKAYEVLGTTESVYTEEEEEHKTVTTAPLTEYYLTDKTDYNIEVDRMMKDLIIDEINHDRDHIKPHFQDEPDPVHLHFCMRHGYLAFFWRLMHRCCSWFTYICGIIFI